MGRNHGIRMMPLGNASSSWMRDCYPSCVTGCIAYILNGSHLQLRHQSKPQRGCSFPRSAGSSKTPRPLHLLKSLSKANCRHYKGIVGAGVMIQPVRFLYYIVSSSQSPCYSLSWEPPTTVAGASSKATKTEAQWLQGLLTRDLCLKMGVAGKLRTQL